MKLPQNRLSFRKQGSFLIVALEAQEPYYSERIPPFWIASMQVEDGSHDF
jgi:hypothetical protein